MSIKEHIDGIRKEFIDKYGVDIEISIRIYDVDYAEALKITLDAQREIGGDIKNANYEDAAWVECKNRKTNTEIVAFLKWKEA